MTVIRSKDVVTINDLSEEKRSSDGPSVLEAIEGFQGYAERTLIDKKVSQEISLGDCVFEPGAVVPSHRHDVEEAFYVFEAPGMHMYIYIYIYIYSERERGRDHIYMHVRIVSKI